MPMPACRVITANKRHIILRNGRTGEWHGHCSGQDEQNTTTTRIHALTKKRSVRITAVIFGCFSAPTDNTHAAGLYGTVHASASNTTNYATHTWRRSPFFCCALVRSRVRVCARTPALPHFNRPADARTAPAHSGKVISAIFHGAACNMVCLRRVACFVYC